MRHRRIIRLSLVIGISVFLIYILFPKPNRRIEAFRPYIKEIEISQQLYEETLPLLKQYSKGVKHNFLAPGNFPITLQYRELEGEEAEYLALAEVDEEECIISFNQKYIWQKTQYKLVLFHELGHCMGLDDTPQEDEIMGEYYGNEKKQIANLPRFFRIISLSIAAHLPLQVKDKSYSKKTVPSMKVRFNEDKQLFFEN